MSTVSAPAERAAERPSRLITYPAPPGEPASKDYAVHVNGRPVFCYTSYRFDPESKTTIAGRPVSPVTFCSFDHEGEVEVDVRFLEGLKEAGLDTSRVVVRPLSHGIRPRVRDGRIRFRIQKPCQLSIEPGGAIRHPLHLFANPLEKDVPDERPEGALLRPRLPRGKRGGAAERRDGLHRRRCHREPEAKPAGKAAGRQPPPELWGGYLLGAGLFTAVGRRT